MYEACDLVGSYLLCQGLLADAQELIDTYLTELELINMSTNSQMYHRKQKNLFNTAINDIPCVVKRHTLDRKIGFFLEDTIQECVYSYRNARRRKKVYFYNNKTKLDDISEFF